MLEIEQAIYLKQNVNFLKFRYFQRQINIGRKSTFKWYFC